MANIFLLLGRNTKQNFAKYGYVSAAELLTKCDKNHNAYLFECNNADEYAVAISRIKEISAQSSTNTNHLILYAHANSDRRMNFGAEILPEDLFQEIADSTRGKRNVVSIFGCYTGHAIKSDPARNRVNIELSAHDAMIVYCDKRETIDRLNVENIAILVRSGSVKPQIIIPNFTRGDYSRAPSFTLTPPGTKKIIIDEGVYEFSPFEVLKIDRDGEERKAISKDDVKKMALLQHMQMSLIFDLNALTDHDLISDTFNHAKLNCKLATSLEPLSEVTKHVTCSNIDDYLKDLALIVIICKDGAKVKYLQRLVEELGVDFKANSFALQAAAAGNLAALRYLAEQDKEELTRKVGDKSPMSLAITNNNLMVIDYLLGNGVVIDEDNGLRDLLEKGDQYLQKIHQFLDKPEVDSKSLQHLRSFLKDKVKAPAKTSPRSATPALPPQEREFATLNS